MSSKSWCQIWGALLLAALAAPGLAGGETLFYKDLLRQGIAARQLGQLDDATETLRLACFGLLETPNALAECLTHLALAHDAQGDRQELEKTWRRLIDIEKRFQAYSRAQLDGGIRRELEGKLVQWAKVEDLQAAPAFQALGELIAEQRLESLKPAQKRTALEELIISQPDALDWRLQLARLSLEQDDPRGALGTLDGLLAKHPAHVEARCLKGQAQAALGSCAEAQPGLSACARHLPSRKTAAGVLTCYVELDDWPRARALVAELPPELRRGQPFRRLEKKIRQSPGETGEGDPLPATTVPEDAVPEGTVPEEIAASEDRTTAAASPPPTPEPKATLPPQIVAEIAQLRRQMEQATVADQLNETRQRAKQIADAYPQASEAQFLMTQLGFLTTRWSDVITYFRRANRAEASPDTVFYYAVALFENGDSQQARAELERCLPKIQRTAFVNSYVAKILPGA